MEELKQYFVKEYQRKYSENSESEISLEMENINNTDITLQVETTVKKTCKNSKQITAK